MKNKVTYLSDSRLRVTSSERLILCGTGIISMLFCIALTIRGWSHITHLMDDRDRYFTIASVTMGNFGFIVGALFFREGVREFHYD